MAKKKRKENKGFQVTQMIVPVSMVSDIRRMIAEEEDRNNRDTVTLKRDQIISKADAEAIRHVRDLVKQLRKPMAVLTKVQRRLDDVEPERLTRDDEKWVDRTSQELYDLRELVENLA